MRRQMKAALAVAATLALAVIVVSSASAQGLPTVSPTAPTNTTDIIATSVLVLEFSNGNTVKCETSSVGNTVETKSPAAEGEFHLMLKGCEGELAGIKAKCTGLGDATTGEILMLGNYHLAYDTGGMELGVAILYLVASTHFTCGGLFLEIVSGEQVCLMDEPYVLGTLEKMKCIKESGVKGVQKETWLNDSAVAIRPKLISSEGEGTSLTAALEGKGLMLFLSSTKVNVQTIIIMN